MPKGGGFQKLRPVIARVLSYALFFTRARSCAQPYRQPLAADRARREVRERRRAEAGPREVHRLEESLRVFRIQRILLPSRMADCSHLRLLGIQDFSSFRIWNAFTQASISFLAVDGPLSYSEMFR